MYPDPQKDLKIRSPRTIGELYKDYIGAIKGLYRGSNFKILPRVWVGHVAVRSLTSSPSYGPGVAAFVQSHGPRATTRTGRHRLAWADPANLQISPKELTF